MPSAKMRLLGQRLGARLWAIRLSTAGLTICGFWQVQSLMNFFGLCGTFDHFSHRRFVLHGVPSLPKQMDYVRSDDGPVAGDRRRFGRHPPQPRTKWPQVLPE